MTRSTEAIIASAGAGELLSDGEALALGGHEDLPSLLDAACARRDRHHGSLVSYSPKVFIPLTQLCRDVCRYCTFARPPRRGQSAYLPMDEVLAIAEAGARAGCHEALFTLGDKPEQRYRVAREGLSALGHDTTIDYLVEAAARVHDATGLLPHVNPGVMSRVELERLRPVSVSAGLMLESVSGRLCQRGGPHHGCPDKQPRVRLETIATAGELAIPFTTGILIGIGETRRERMESLLALRALHGRYGHVQEIIVQNFRAKAGTAMADAPEPALEEHLWTIAMARLIFHGAMSIQAPPNLSAGNLHRLLGAGINDWGGISPVTPDFVNPEAPWPHLDALAEATQAAGKELVPRLPVYPSYVRDPHRWIDEGLRASLLVHQDAHGYARENHWVAGATGETPGARKRRNGVVPAPCGDAELHAALDRAGRGDALDEGDIVRLFAARGREHELVCRSADDLRRVSNGDTVSYVVNRNINYTNVCYFACRFCAFSKGKRHEGLRGAPYDLDLGEIRRRTREAWQRGATEICLQGGIHPDYTGETYLEICRAVKAAAPDIHVHAFSPLEVTQGAMTLGISLQEFLSELKHAGLGSLPGTAAEILDDEIRAVICPDKIDTSQWLDVMRTAHGVGLPTTATIMFGHVDGPLNWARHLLRVRGLQAETGGFTEFVPLAFVHMQAPMFRRGLARKGPTYREAILMHAVARLTLHPHVTNIQASWVKMGPEGAGECLASGANDVGGTLMNESITRAAGAEFGQEMPPEELDALIRAAGREPRQRTTLYRDPPGARIEASFGAAPLDAMDNRPVGRRSRGEKPLAVRFGSG
jgi:FO synthase